MFRYSKNQERGLALIDTAATEFAAQVIVGLGGGSRPAG